MNLTIRPLGPDDAERYVQYLNHLDFHHAPDWSGCYCRYYHTTCTNEAWAKRSADENKAEALAAIQDGSMKGFLAFDGDQVIGWLNANQVEAYPRLRPFIEPYLNNEKAGCVVCFVIHPEYRKQGVASALLKAAVDQFKKDGYDFVVAAPFENKEEPEKAYRGSISMYLKTGFTVIDSRDNMAIVKKELKS